jgi:hypothetical protein
MSVFEPTTNRVPWKLLTKEEQKILLAWPHGWQHCWYGRWFDYDYPEYAGMTVVRGKPAPEETTFIVTFIKML